MPRLESRTPCSIWDKRAWTSLPIDCQWFYLMLKSQFGVSHAGVLQIPRREWTNLASDEDVATRIAHARKICEERNYIAIDETTDEVLIRTYLRTDIINGPPGTFRASMDAICAVRSEKLKTILRGELLRLDVGVIEAKKVGRGRRETALQAYHRALTALGHHPGGGEEVPEDSAVPAVEDAMVMASDNAEDAMVPTSGMASSRPRTWHGDAMVKPSQVWHDHGMGDAPVVVDVVVDGSSSVGSPVEFKDAASRTDARARTREAHVRAAHLVGAVLPRNLGNRLTREKLHTCLGQRLDGDLDDELTDDVVRAALTRWVDTSKVTPAAIEYMLDDAIKESRGANPVRRGGRIGTADIFAAGSALVTKYEAQEAAEAEAEYAAVRPIHRGAM